MLSTALATAAFGQGDTAIARPAGPVGAIDGVVYDSLLVTGPLRGATVYVIGETRVSSTDSRGRFSIADVPEGDHVLTFAHPLFDSLGVQAPQVAVHVAAGAKTRTLIATPAGASILRAACPGAQAEQTGLLLGVVRNIETGAPLPGARVTSRWFELTIDRAGQHYGTLEIATTSDASGVFRLCGVPADIPVLVRAQAGTQQSGRVEVYFNGADVTFRHFAVSTTDTAARAIPDSMLATSEDSTRIAPVRGSAFVRGIVRDLNGRPVANAEVSLLDRRGSVRTDANGRFALPDVPSGTQTLELRAIGYEPTRQAVVLRPGTPTDATIALGRAAQQLQSVRVLGRSGSSFLTNQGFEDRRHRSMGWFLTEDDIKKQGGSYLSDVLRSAPGVIPNYTSRGRTFTMRSLALGDRCTPSYYLDGLRWYPLDQDPIIELEKFVPLSDVAGVEVYRGGGSTPAQFDANNGCGAIVFWTKH